MSSFIVTDLFIIIIDNNCCSEDDDFFLTKFFIWVTSGFNRKSARKTSCPNALSIGANFLEWGSWFY
jgi:hypothetical protein